MIARPGYDADTRIFLALSGDLAGFDVPLRPTKDDVNAARERVEEVFADFPFVDDASRANAIALFITPELRPAVRGNVPLALIDAPQPGSGKSLVAEIVALKSTGSAACMRPAPTRDEEEWRKTLTANIRAGLPMTVFDNVDAVLESANLALALTATTWSDRVLGQSTLVTLPVRTIFVATGNNLSLGGDIPRRCYWIRIDAATPEPWRDRQYRHPDLTGWVLANRGRLLGAVLTLARAWFVADCPPSKTPILGSYEEWCRVVGGILAFASIDGFLGNLDELYEQSDPTVAAWEAFLSALLKKMPPKGFGVADVVTRLCADSELLAVLPEDLGDLDPLGKFRKQLGWAFRKRANRRYGGQAVYLVKLSVEQGVVVWCVKEKEKKEEV